MTEERKEYMKQYYADNKEKIKEYEKNHKVQIQEKGRQYYANNKESIKEKRKQYRENNPDKIKSMTKKYYEKHKEKMDAVSKQYRIDNKEYLHEYDRKYYEEHKDYKTWCANQRYATNICFKLLTSIRHRLNWVINNNSKTARTKELLGCDVPYLKSILVLKFTEGMSWENYNYNGWHLDHILPCYYFDFSNPIHQKVCFNYRNLQPLWGEDNMSKGASLGDDWQQKLYEICFALGIGPKQVFNGSKFPLGDTI